VADYEVAAAIKVLAKAVDRLADAAVVAARTYNLIHSPEMRPPPADDGWVQMEKP
jgi:hypothetical protein